DSPGYVVGCRVDLARLQAEEAKHVVRPQEHVGVEMPLPTAGLGELLGSVQHGALGTGSVSVMGARLTVSAWWSLPGTFTCAGVRHMKVIGRGDPSPKPGLAGEP